MTAERMEEILDEAFKAVIGFIPRTRKEDFLKTRIRRKKKKTNIIERTQQ